MVHFGATLVVVVLLGVAIGDLLCAAWRLAFGAPATGEPAEPVVRIMRVRRWPWCVRHRARPWWVFENGSSQRTPKRPV